MSTKNQKNHFPRISDQSYACMKICISIKCKLMCKTKKKKSRQKNVEAKSICHLGLQIQ